MKHLIIVLVLISFVAMSAGLAMAGEEKSVCSNPIKETIDKTASIKAMQSQPAKAPCYKCDVMGTKLPAQTDNSGKRPG